MPTKTVITQSPSPASNLEEDIEGPSIRPEKRIQQGLAVSSTISDKQVTFNPSDLVIDVSDGSPTLSDESVKTPAGLEVLVKVRMVTLIQSRDKRLRYSCRHPGANCLRLICVGTCTVGGSSAYRIVLNDGGEEIFFGSELSGCCCTVCIGQNRPFSVNLYDQDYHHVMRIERSCNCAFGFWGGRIAGNVIFIKSGHTNELYATVIQKCGFFNPSFIIFDDTGDEILRMEGPKCGSFCTCRIFCEASFPVYLPDDDDGEILNAVTTDEGKVKVKGCQNGKGEGDKDVFELGAVDKKKERGLRCRTLVGNISKVLDSRRSCPDVNLFETCIEMHPAMSPRSKAALIGAAFAVDFTYFESHRCDCSGYGWIYKLFIIGILLVITYTTLQFLYNHGFIHTNLKGWL